MCAIAFANPKRKLKHDKDFLADQLGEEYQEAREEVNRIKNVSP